MSVEPKIIPGKMGGWRPNSGRKPGFVGHWTGKKRPDLKSEHLKKYIKTGEENFFHGKSWSATSHPRWAGGTWGFWKQKVLHRDNFTCAVCRLFDPEVMQVDHIIPKRKLKSKEKEVLFNMNNLQTLCANCHVRKTKSEFREGAKGKSKYSI